MFHQTTHTSPILCMSSAIGDFLNDGKLQRDEFSFPVVFTPNSSAITKFPTTLFTTHLNSTQRELFLNLERKIKPVSVDPENRLRLGNRFSGLTFHIIANDDDNESKHCNNEIIGLSTEEDYTSGNVEEMPALQLHYFDVKNVEKDHLFDQSWTCPPNHYVDKIQLYRKDNCLIALQLFSRSFPSDDPFDDDSCRVVGVIEEFTGMFCPITILLFLIICIVLLWLF